MKAVFKHLWIVVLCGLFVGTASPLFAQTASDTGADAIKSTVAADAKAAGPKTTQTPEAFERTQRLETMRYRHLWIAYGAIWFIIFFFVFRTWRLNQSTSSELERLKSRLADLESNHGAR
ncbi:MAG: hypothetical protein VX589_01710 [Myxococcota bacterium]|nr:hypothetical protein [Myxococcota bacterium]